MGRLEVTMARSGDRPALTVLEDKTSTVSVHH